MLNDAIKGKPQATEQVLMLAERAGRLSSLNPECQRGVLVVPGVSKSREDWERDHGADARGEKIFNREGRPIVTLAFTPEQGRELLNAGRLDEALACYHHVLANYAPIRDRRQPSADDDLDGRDAVIGIGILSILFSFGGEFTKALACADEAISWFTPYEHHPVARNYLGEFRQLRGDALMFLGRTDEGREFYLSLRGKKFKANGSKRRKTWESLILRQFDRLREHGRSHPLMDEI